jgi:hypothetical protein
VRGLFREATLIPWNEALEDAFFQASSEILESLSRLAPRGAVVGLGLFSLEPYSRRGGEEGEMEFAQKVLETGGSLGFSHARVGLGDSLIAAVAVARHLTTLSSPIHRVPPGQDAEALAPLPVRTLPISCRVLELLDHLGVQRIEQLQEMDPHPLVARFGPEGRRAWRLALGLDPRQPRSPGEEAPNRVQRLLANPCVHLESLLFVLRPALEEMTTALGRRGQGVARLALTLSTTGGESFTVHASPATPTGSPSLLFRLLRRALEEERPRSHGEIEDLELHATALAPLRARQGDLFQQMRGDPAILEAIFHRLQRQLGPDTLVLPITRDTHHPALEGGWEPLCPGEDGASSPTAGSRLTSCVRRLEPPQGLTPLSPGLFRLVGDGHRIIKVVSWHPPERLSGHWWDEPYDQTHHWALTEDHRLLWLRQDHRDERWWLQGWVD